MKKTIILLWLISVLFCNLAIEEEMKSKTKLVYGKWGDKPGEFGLKAGENPMERGGPNDFFVNADDKIYVLDNINKTVQVFSSQGKYERTDQKLYQEAISKGNERTIAFEDGSRITYGTGFLLKENEDRCPNAQRYNVEPIYEDFVKYPTRFNLVFPDNNKTMIELTKPPIGQKVMGEDKCGNVFIFFNVTPKGPYEIIKINSQYRILGRIKIGMGRIFYINDGRIRLSPRGDLYIMNSDETGFWIDCYPTELFDKPEGRDFSYLYEKNELTEQEEEKERLKTLKDLALRLAKTTRGEMGDSAIAYLGRNKITEAIPIFQDYLKQETETETTIHIQKRCLYALKEIGTDKSIELILKYGLKNKDKETKIKATELLINTPAEKEAIETIKEMIKDSKLERKIAEKLVYTGNWLRNNNKKEAIEIWIELLKIPKASKLAREYLEESTGQDFGGPPNRMVITKQMLEQYVKKWQDWWEKNKDTFEFPEK